jgi:8-oxo-dGTP diphosphatase
MPYTPILATLGYVLSPDRRRVLMVRRDRRPDDQHLGKYNGLGGKLEADEDVVAGLRREVREEAGIECRSLRLRGTVSWPGFGRNGKDWFGFVFTIDRWEGAPLTENAEGTLLWVPVDKLLELPLWEGDRHFLPLVFDDAVAQFHGLMPYRAGQPGRWQCTILDARGEPT